MFLFNNVVYVYCAHYIDLKHVHIMELANEYSSPRILM